MQVDLGGLVGQAVRPLQADPQPTGLRYDRSGRRPGQGLGQGIAGGRLDLAVGPQPTDGPEQIAPPVLGRQAEQTDLIGLNADQGRQVQGTPPGIRVGQSVQHVDQFGQFRLLIDQTGDQAGQIRAQHVQTGAALDQVQPLQAVEQGLIEADQVQQAPDRRRQIGQVGGAGQAAHPQILAQAHQPLGAKAGLAGLGQQLGRATGPDWPRFDRLIGDRPHRDARQGQPDARL